MPYYLDARKQREILIEIDATYSRSKIDKAARIPNLLGILKVLSYEKAFL